MKQTTTLFMLAASFVVLVVTYGLQRKFWRGWLMQGT